MESMNGYHNWTKSLTGMFIGHASKEKCKYSSLMGEVILTRVKGDLRILGLGSE